MALPGGIVVVEPWGIRACYFGRCSFRAPSVRMLFTLLPLVQPASAPIPRGIRARTCPEQHLGTWAPGPPCDRLSKLKLIDEVVVGVLIAREPFPAAHKYRISMPQRAVRAIVSNLERMELFP
jgi:hypothetical protein